jgi:hypothetical protein
MVGSQIPWTWVAVGAPLLFLVVLGVLVWRMRRIRAEEQEILLRQQEVMAQRLAEVEKVPPLAIPPALQSRPEETWAKYRLPGRRFARKNP